MLHTVTGGKDPDFVIKDIRATTVSMPLEAPLRHAAGAHWGRFVRTIVEIETADGLIGLGEMGGGGESAEATIKGLLPNLAGMNPFNLEQIRFAICNPTASLYNNRTQIHAALEFACLDLVGKKLGISVSDLLGGRVRDEVEFASYLFYRYGHPDTGEGEVRTIEQLVAETLRLKAEHGFRAHKLKGGVFGPDFEIDGYLAMADALPGDSFRYDPNGTLSVIEGIRVSDRIAGVNNDWLEDPCWGLEANMAVRRPGLLLATNQIVVNFEQLASNMMRRSMDVILLDTTFWGGIRPCIKAAGICETFGMPIAVHSSGELGIQLATMLHMGAVVPNLTFTADAHYHHLRDDIIVGGKMKYVDGAIAVPDGPGLGVELDRDKLGHYADEFKRLGGYPYDRDPGRPGWFPLVPNTRWADPTDPIRPSDPRLAW